MKNTPNVLVSVLDKVVTVKYNETYEKKIKADAVKTNIEVFRTRLDKLSVAEISIAAEGEKSIVVELPDVEDPMQARTMIGKPAILEFKLVERMGASPEDILYEYDGVLPDDMQILPGKAQGSRSPYYYMVPRYTNLTGKDLKDARPNFGGQTGSELVVGFELSSTGGDIFYELTRKNPGRQLAVVLDGIVITAPKINEPIAGGSGSITGGFTSAQAKELAMLLKSGSLVAPVTIEGERQIGPSLGASSIKQGLIACLVGLGLLLVFGLFYYSLAGFFAFLALMFNLVLVLFGLSTLGAVLTLQGIAGMVLTIGMAIDASILIYERIKEELKLGKSVKDAVNAGFSSAMIVILDANITTFIVGVVLYKFGTGPIQGFAATMMLGIISTLITGLFFLKSIFMFWINNFKVKYLKI